MPNRIVEELLSAYVELRRFLGRRLANPDDAADVAQSSFERVYARGLTATLTTPRSLLFRTAQRICIDAARHRDVVRRWEEHEGVLLRDANFASAERLAASRQLVQKIVQRLEQMPARRVLTFPRLRLFAGRNRAAARNYRSRRRQARCARDRRLRARLWRLAG
jgi:DNA-directed RNA polymerase specialized sigma24 family protein